MNGVSKSVTTSTKIVNGKRVSVMKTVVLGRIGQGRRRLKRRLMMGGGIRVLGMLMGRIQYFGIST